MPFYVAHISKKTPSRSTSDKYGAIYNGFNKFFKPTGQPRFDLKDVDVTQYNSLKQIEDSDQTPHQKSKLCLKFAISNAYSCCMTGQWFDEVGNVVFGESSSMRTIFDKHISEKVRSEAKAAREISLENLVGTEEMKSM